MKYFKIVISFLFVVLKKIFEFMIDIYLFSKTYDGKYFDDEKHLM